MILVRERVPVIRLSGTRYATIGDCGGGWDIAFHRKLVSPISVASLHLLLLAELLHYCANSLIIMKKKVFGGKKHNKLLLAASTQCFEI